MHSMRNVSLLAKKKDVLERKEQPCWHGVIPPLASLHRRRAAAFSEASAASVVVVCLPVRGWVLQRGIGFCISTTPEVRYSIAKS